MEPVFIVFLVAFSLTIVDGKQDNKSDDEQAVKCDACKLIVGKFADSFKEMEKMTKNIPLQEDEYLEAAESTCDEEWTGYALENVDGHSTLVKKTTDSDGVTEELWAQRLQDFCDEILAEVPDEKTLYETWLKNQQELENYLCKGKDMFGACSAEDFGPWPGNYLNSDDEDDLDDYDYFHDEF